MKKRCFIKKLDPRIGNEFQTPGYATAGSAGIDLIACLQETLHLAPGQVASVPTGIALWIRDKGYAGMVIPRSGLGHRDGLVLGNLTGLIDSDYQGEIIVSLWNRTQTPKVVEVGIRIAQCVIVPVVQAEFQWVSSFPVETERGESAFGSTGL